MDSSYWPSVTEIQRCIKTEAEELSDAVLMAVHEPMTISRVSAGESEGELVGELELLKHVISTNRPTPVLGQSGYGKSHVIRWLDINLRRRNSDDGWHIVRIPKNASLKQALTILLQDLEGPRFEDARNKIDTVGRDLNTRTVAKHLVVFVEARLEELFDEAEEQLRAAQELGHQLSEEENRRIRKVRKHAKRSGLPALIGDSVFSKQLVEEDRCFYQIAKRFTEGSTDQEIEENVFQVDASDLELSAELGDLSSDARTYTKNARLNTSEEAREDAVTLLNECLTDACREAFQQLFQFDSGSFQDLFHEIRASLKEANKKLFILVEDMATISAIEDVLIDSLMQEDVRDGKQVLCPLHSAIAVTEGYHGYTRRRDTLITRAKYEWFIGRSVGTEEDTYSRIENFCGRYLNAARIGEAALAETFGSSSTDATWPDTWESDDKAEHDVAEVFGKSPSGFPLFPYNKSAIRALANQFVKPHESVVFNPRKILQHVLREPLENFRGAYSNRQFPPPEFAGIRCPSSLLKELELEVRENKERSYAVAAVWGAGAQSLGGLAHRLPPEIPRAFSLESLAGVIESTTPTKEDIPPGQKKEERPPIEPVGGAAKDKVERGTDPHAIDNEVDRYFETENIPQREANEIRQALVAAYEFAQKDFREWYGIGHWPKLKQRVPPIYIPFNPNNPAQPLLEFGTEKEFRDTKTSQRYRRFVVAILRRNRESSTKRWDYSGGLQDYSYYKNFLDSWLPESASRLVETERDKAKVDLLKRLEETVCFAPRIATAKISEKIDALVLTSDQLKTKVNSNTGLSEWDQFISAQLDGWDEKQQAWLSAFSINRHGVEGDLLRSALRGTSEISLPPKAQRAAQQSRSAFVRQFPEFELLKGCTTFEEFERVMKSLEELVSKLNSAQQFKEMGDLMTARQFKNRLVKVLQADNWREVKAALVLQEPFTPVETTSALHDFDAKSIEIVAECLTTWTAFVERNLTRLRNDNAEHGADTRKKIEDNFEKLLRQVGTQLEQHRSQ